MWLDRGDADYDDAYPTCLETHAAFRLYHRHLTADALTAALEIEPTESGESVRQGVSRTHWLLSSESHVLSKDVRRHVDWLLTRLAGAGEALAMLAQGGAEYDVFCFWYGIGQGGPMLSPRQLRGLAELDCTIGFDIYFAE